jgi:Fic family protein
MKDLFKYLETASEPVLIKSCVFHYETEFIHPFMDGNGRMGRLWQTLILMSEYPLFQYLPVEVMVRESREDYYRALSMSDKSGDSAVFIEYMLDIIDRTLADLLQLRSRKLTAHGRLEYFLSLGMNEFSRKDYLDVFRDISPATASRDLQKGVEKGVIMRTGDKNTARYKS